MRKLTLVTAFLVGFALFQTKPAEALFITGELDLAGGVRITAGGLMDFIPPVAPATTGCPGGSSCGIEDISKTTNTGYYTPFNGAIQYHIAELDLAANVATASGCTPEQQAAFPAFCGDFAEIPDFERTPSSIQFSVVPLVAIGGAGVCTFLGGTVDGANCNLPIPSPLPNLTFSLTTISACTTGCNFGFAPQFNVVVTTVNGHPQTSIIMNVAGNVCDPGSGFDCTPYSGIFTAQFPNRTPASLIAELGSNGYIQTSFSASKISSGPTAVPEPATLLLFGTGTVIVAARARRRMKKGKKDAEVK